MADPTIPAATLKAAKRGFIRTTAQAYSTALAGGISTTAILSIISGGNPDLVALSVTVGVTLLSPVLAGAASFLSILARGVPEDYRNAA